MGNNFNCLENHLKPLMHIYGDTLLNLKLSLTNEIQNATFNSKALNAIFSVVNLNMFILVPIKGEISYPRVHFRSNRLINDVNYGDLTIRMVANLDLMPQKNQPTLELKSNDAAVRIRSYDLVSTYHTRNQLSYSCGSNCVTANVWEALQLFFFFFLWKNRQSIIQVHDRW